MKTIKLIADCQNGIKEVIDFDFDVNICNESFFIGSLAYEFTGTIGAEVSAETFNALDKKYGIKN